MVIFTNPSARAGYDTRSIFKRSLTGLKSDFSFYYTSCLTKAEEPSLSYYLPIAGGRIIGFIPSPRVLVLYEMQSVTSRIWTPVAVSISITTTPRAHSLLDGEAFFSVGLGRVGTPWLPLCSGAHWARSIVTVKSHQWIKSLFPTQWYTDLQVFFASCLHCLIIWLNITK